MTLVRVLWMGDFEAKLAVKLAAQALGENANLE
jgi:hypothetical protein